MYKIYDEWPIIARKSFESKQKDINFKNIEHIVIAGMGGSGAIGDILSSILSKTKIHVNVIKGYVLPSTVNENTLVITISVSGNTVETLSVLKSANEIKSKIIAFSSGGKMEVFCKNNKIEHRLANEERIEEIKPGRFTSSQSGTATFFVEGVKDGDLNNIFFSSLRDDKGTVESSYSASYFFDEDERKYILLKKGIINELLDGVQNRITTYEEHVIQLGQNLPTYTNNRAAAKSTIELAFSDKKTDSAELQSRLLLPLTTLILGFLAIPLSYSAPKKGRYSKIFLGITAYFIYFISTSITKKLYLIGYTPDFMGIWWIHIIALGIVVLLYYNDNTKIPGRS